MEARKLNVVSSLHSSFIINNETLSARVDRVRQWDALGILKKYWNNNSVNVGEFVNYVKDKSQNISAYLPG